MESIGMCSRDYQLYTKSISSFGGTQYVTEFQQKNVNECDGKHIWSGPSSLLP